MPACPGAMAALLPCLQRLCYDADHFHWMSSHTLPHRQLALNAGLDVAAVQVALQQGDTQRLGECHGLGPAAGGRDSCSNLKLTGCWLPRPGSSNYYNATQQALGQNHPHVFHAHAVDDLFEGHRRTLRRQPHLQAGSTSARPISWTTHGQPACLPACPPAKACPTSH